jgi:hypothetical protein
MLTRFHKILIGLLAAQLVLIVIVMTRGNDNRALKEHTLIPGFDVAKVTRVQVSSSGEAAKTIDLIKRDAGWVVASGFDYPADQTKVSDALTPIAKLSAAAPIATQAGRHKQLHVADTDFERKLVITRDGKDLTLYIGGSAGARRTAVRVAGDDNVYGVTGISIGVVGTEARQWVDASYVKISKDEIAKVVVQREGSTVVLSRSVPPAPAGSGSGAGSGSAGGSGSAAESDAAPPGPPAAEHWNVEVRGAPVTLAGGETIDEATIDRLVNQAATLELSSPADPKRDASRPTATITIERKASGTTTPAPTVIEVIADGTSYWVHDRSVPRAVLVDKARIDELVNIDRDKVVKKPPPPPAPPTGAGSGSAARPVTGAGPTGPGPAGTPGGVPRPPGAAAPTPPAPGAPRPPTAAAPAHAPGWPATGPAPTGAGTGSAAKPATGAGTGSAAKPATGAGAAAKPGGGSATRP